MSSTNNVDDLIAVIKSTAIFLNAFAEADEVTEFVLDQMKKQRDCTLTVSDLDSFKSIQETKKLISRIQSQSNTSTDLNEELLSFAMCNFLRVKSPKIFQILSFLKILDTHPLDYEVNFEKLNHFVSDPVSYLKQEYEDSHGEIFKLFDNQVRRFLSTYLARVDHKIPSKNITNYVNISDNVEPVEAMKNSAVLFLNPSGSFKPYVALEFFPCLIDRGFSYIVSPLIGLDHAKSFEFNKNWLVNVDSSLDKRPNFLLLAGFERFEFVKFIEESENTKKDFYNTELRFLYVPTDGIPLGGNSMMLRSGPINWSIVVNEVRIGLEVKDAEGVDFYIKTQINTKFANSAEDDGFLNKLLPEEGLETEVEITPIFSVKHGFSLEASGDLEATIPIHRKIGPVYLEEGSFGLDISEDQMAGFATVSFAAKVGPITATVEEIGVDSILSFESGGNLGIVDLKPPTMRRPKGAGLQLDATLIKGGGYLDYAVDEKRYAGILTLGLQALEITAIGLITTQLPNGKSGFSMLVSMNAIFRPAIQLSFGFTLNGVGGLVGINRTMKIDVLRERFKTGAIESIMFPEDPIENADRIISDLQAIFPAEEDHFVVAPFLRLGWGINELITVDLGVFVELPFKNRLILLGGLSMILPDRRAALIEINVDIFGDLNFAEQYVLIHGVLRDSRIRSVLLVGDFAFFLSWGTNPQFLLSVGGFHPNYEQPAGFPVLSRLNAVFKKGKNLQLVCDLYQAVTSNTFQIGITADLLVKIKKIEIDGHLSFDALFRFEPFQFETTTHITADVSRKGKKYAGLDLYLNLSGPQPWLANGYVEGQIMTFDFRREFSYTWGGKQPEIEPIYADAEKLLSKVVAELKADQNWTVQFPTQYSSVESLTPIDDQEEGLFLHPAGMLEVRQNVAPFYRPLEKHGNAKFKTLPKLEFGEVRLGDSSTLNYGKVEEYFALSQFEELTDEEKLSGDDFVRYTAGVRFETDGHDAVQVSEDYAQDSLSAYETIIINEDLTRDYPSPLSQFPDLEDNYKATDQLLRGFRRRKKNLGSRGLVHTLGPKYRSTTPVLLEEIQDYIVIDELSGLEATRFREYAHARTYLKVASRSEGLLGKVINLDMLKSSLL